MQIKILLVEDDRVTQKWILSQLSANDRFNLTIKSTFADGAKALVNETFNILLVDIQLPDGHGLDLIKMSYSLQPNCQIMVMTVFGDKETVLNAIAAGASGYILKDASGDDIAEAIDDLLRGESPLSPKIARMILNQMRPQETSNKEVKEDKNNLTPREIEILVLASRGKSYNEISAMLAISRYTVSDHVKNIYRKLEVHSRSQAIFEAIQHGYIEL